jgi:hypothetical protein
MIAAQRLQEMGESLWFDNVTHGVLATGSLECCIQELSIKGLKERLCRADFTEESMYWMWILIAMPFAGLICFACLIARTGGTHASKAVQTK